MGTVGRIFIPRTGEEGVEPPIAQVQLEGQVVVMFS